MFPFLYTFFLGRNCCFSIEIGFISDILQVERVEIVNQKFARIVLKSEQGGLSQATPYVNVGSVDSFGRNLESVQRSMNRDPGMFIPVLYKNEFDA